MEERKIDFRLVSHLGEEQEQQSDPSPLPPHGKPARRSKKKY